MSPAPWTEPDLPQRLELLADGHHPGSTDVPAAPLQGVRNLTELRGFTRFGRNDELHDPGRGVLDELVEDAHQPFRILFVAEFGQFIQPGTIDRRARQLLRDGCHATGTETGTSGAGFGAPLQ